MVCSNRVRIVSRYLFVFLTFVVFTCTTPRSAAARPLLIQKQGSFFIGGVNKHRGPNDDITIDQMYVRYQIPANTAHHLPVVMIHGCCLSGKSWGETPDGRMGWNEYFVRRHRPVYVIDQVARARSGFDATVFNEVRAGTLAPSALPSILQVSDQSAWDIFRFGPIYGTPYPDEQFPVGSLEEFWKQLIPDLNSMLPAASPTYTDLSALAIRLGGAVLMGHSESGFFPQFAALVNTKDIKGLITLEHSCNPLTPQQIATLATIPTLVVFGDHLSTGGFASHWIQALHDCTEYVQQVNDAGGDATLIHLPDFGIYGNSHMMMLDKNNLQVADVILKWIGEHVENHHSRAHHHEH